MADLLNSASMSAPALCDPRECEQRYPKTNDLRIIDVLLLGPFMVWFGYRAKGLPDWAKFVMIVSGILTVTYNGYNYIRRAAMENGGKFGLGDAVAQVTTSVGIEPCSPCKQRQQLLNSVYTYTAS